MSPAADNVASNRGTNSSVNKHVGEHDASLPAQWFRDERIYHMERRAIFSKLWLLSTHVSRFEKAGDYLKLEFAGIPYLVIKTKEGSYNAFHNVCRHRAFPLVHKETGSSTILGCKYHGWSYSSSTGALIKAPQFPTDPKNPNAATSPNFHKEEYGLFKIHTHVTPSGFIFINFNAAPLKPTPSYLEAVVEKEKEKPLKNSPKSAEPAVVIGVDNDDNKPRSASSKAPTATPDQVSSSVLPEPGPSPASSTDEEELVSDNKSDDSATLPPSHAEALDSEVEKANSPKVEYTAPFEEHFSGLPSEWEGFKPEDYEYAYSWTRVGPYNWKTLIDGYQECYHCQIAHPGFAKSLALETYAVSPKTNYARHSVDSKFGPNAIRPGRASENETPPSFIFIFPTCGVTITDTMWYMMRVVPISAVETRMEYDVFKRKTVSMEDLRDYMAFYEQVEDEDFMLCCATQRNLNTGIYSRGILHPEKENGVLFYQSRVREFVEKHLAMEKEVGYEVNPAQPLNQVEGGAMAACGGGPGPGGGGDLVCSSLGPEMTW